MIIARELRSKNIAEYIIYMFQLEDLVRAFNGDMDKIYEAHIKHFNIDNKEMEECKRWYAALCNMMQEENIMSKGHLQFLKHKIAEIESFHYQLLNASEEKEYLVVFNQCIHDLNIYKQKTSLTQSGDVEPALTVLYTILLMRMKKMKINKETSDSIDRISKWVALLAQQYYEFETGKKEIF